MRDGISGWENVALDPAGTGIVISRSTSRPDWNGRSLAAIADDLGGDPAELALDVLADDRLSVDIVIHCMDEADVETILRVPGSAVCTDAEGRRPGHPILDEGVPTRAPTGRRRACSARTCANGASSASRPPSRS